MTAFFEDDKKEKHSFSFLAAHKLLTITLQLDINGFQPHQVTDSASHQSQVHRRAQSAVWLALLLVNTPVSMEQPRGRSLRTFPPTCRASTLTDCEVESNIFSHSSSIQLEICCLVGSGTAGRSILSQKDVMHLGWCQENLAQRSVNLG